MIWYYLIVFFTSLLTAVFSWLPVIETLPTIGGVDIDTYLQLGVGYFLSFSEAIWPLRVIYNGALFLLGYHALMLIVRFFLGHRSP